jgi:predicted enzyme related to lactoylglutathione lyase
MANPVVHFEIRSSDPDATRKFFGQLFGWTFPDGGMRGYTYVDTAVEGAVPGGISPLQGGEPLVTFFVGVPDVAATLEAAVAQGGRVSATPMKPALSRASPVTITGRRPVLSERAPASGEMTIGVAKKGSRRRPVDSGE